MATDEGTMPPETRVGRVALTVSDATDVAAFYRDVVGLEILDQARETRLGVDDTTLVVLREEKRVGDRPRDSAGLYHLAIRVPSRAALGAALERIEAEWHLDGVADHAVSEALYLSDPEGNGVEIYRDRSRDHWPIMEDGSVEMVTDPLDTDGLRAASDGGSHCPTGTDVGHVHLEVSRLEAARDFYVDGLGLGVRQAFGGSALFIAAGDYHHHVGLNTWQRRSDSASGRGLDWFELVVPSESAMMAALERLEQAGYDPQESDGWFEVNDPDSITVRLGPES